MFTTTRRGVARLAAAGATAALLATGALAGAGAALADGTTPSSSGATATLVDIENGQTVDGTQLPDRADEAVLDGNERVLAGLFRMTTPDGGTIETYCIDFFHHTHNGSTYNEVPWKSSTLSGNPDAGKVAWILNNSYPKVDTAALTATLKGAGVQLKHDLTPDIAAAGTQVAIWHFSDPNVHVQAANEDAKALSEYLDSHAQTLDEPKPSLTVDPSAVSGKSGDRLGPVTVHTTADSATVDLAKDAPAGIKIVDKSGKAITGPVKNGTPLYFDIPAGQMDGSTTVTATVTTTIAIGRAFSSVDAKGIASQTMILAGSDNTSVTAAATVSWARKGPIPALSAQVVCSKHGVDVTATNNGDEDFTFTLEGKTYTIAPGKSQTITVPVAEDQKYKIDITLPNGTVKTFEGVLDCMPATTPSPSPSGNQPSSATTGGTGQNLASTGSSSATPMIAGIAAALVVAGGGAVFFFRRKKSSAASE